MQYDLQSKVGSCAVLAALTLTVIYLIGRLAIWLM